MYKRILKERVYGLEVRCLGIIVEGLARQHSKRLILLDLKNEIQKSNLNLAQVEVNVLWGKLTSVLDELIRGAGRLYRSEKLPDTLEELEARRAEIYKLARIQLPDLEKLKNQIADQVEYKAKKRQKDKELNSKTTFFICNWFEDCAKDHIPYQGRVYYNENSPESSTAPVRSCIRNRHMMSIQEVVDQAPWLTTRRNCRHRFFPIKTEEVLRSSSRAILKEHGLRHKHENEYQTVLTPEKVAYIGYYERLKALLQVREVCRNKEVDEDIKKTRIRARLWAKRIKEKNP